MAIRLPGRKLTRRSFHFGSLLGEGAFARVMHVQDPEDDAEYALKMVEKRVAAARGKAKQLLLERQLLIKLAHPNVVTLYASFHDEAYCYFVLELVKGGELAALVDRFGALPKDVFRFFAAELVVVLEHLRRNRVAHRDLKPENILITLDRHIKLIDFDAARVLDAGVKAAPDTKITAAKDDEAATSFVGTAQYVSPEMLKESEETGYAVDLWALGCIVFQMATGNPPFRAPTEYLTFRRIERCEFEIPVDVDADAADLIGALLILDPSQRIGYASVSELKVHHFFEELQGSFEDLYRLPGPDIGPTRIGRTSTAASMFDLEDFEFTPNPGDNFGNRNCEKLSVVASHNFGRSSDVSSDPPREFRLTGLDSGAASPLASGGTSPVSGPKSLPPQAHVDASSFVLTGMGSGSARRGIAAPDGVVKSATGSFAASRDAGAESPTQAPNADVMAHKVRAALAPGEHQIGGSGWIRHRFLFGYMPHRYAVLTSTGRVLLFHRHTGVLLDELATRTLAELSQISTSSYRLVFRTHRLMWKTFLCENVPTEWLEHLEDGVKRPRTQSNGGAECPGGPQKDGCAVS
mmetsp:Transcript_49040/g.129571  ORF Transcript_49040/g.129571 Transcript_49040/m.129571 type:complete len:579 (+) Transcript_49040:165-1901(+)